VLEQAARVADDGAQLEHDRLEIGGDPFPAGRFESAEQPIAGRFDYSSYWHSVRAMLSVILPGRRASEVYIILNNIDHMTPAGHTAG
jgi:hypothetical protein